MIETINYEISPDLEGNLTLRDLLNNEGTISFFPEKDKLIKNLGLYPLFGVYDSTDKINPFSFALSLQGPEIVFQRNEIVSIMTIDDIPENNFGVYIMWNYSELIILIRYGSGENDFKEARIKTKPVTPPNTIINWARKENLLPINEYSNEEDFRNKVHSCLLSVQDKILESNSFSQFWNIEYKKKKLVRRLPKREVEVQPIIHCLLSDQFLMSSIEIIPEYNSSVGNLDFLFIGKLKNNGFVYFSVEFKNAHSDKLAHGYVLQLPEYMQNKKAKYGAYCILDYRGKYFDRPKFKKNETLIQNFLLLKRSKNPSPYHDKIRIIIYKLSKKNTASKL